MRKPAGITSFQALGAIKRAAGTKRVGHAGTLDRFASGLLLVMIGAYCRLASYVEAGEKLYRGAIAFGRETRTLDPEGDTVAEAAAPSRERLESVLPSFRGSLLQRPPLFSAIHLDGKRAYERALAGEILEMPERRVTITELVLESYEESTALVLVRCSPGTYIRSLARDIALACDSRAHLAQLERLAIGPYRLDEACDIDDFEPARDLRQIDPAAARGLGLHPCELDGRSVRSFLNGAALAPSAVHSMDGEGGVVEGRVAVFSPDGGLLGIVDVSDSRLTYRAVLGDQGAA